jgi:hypothetical protein
MAIEYDSYGNRTFSPDEIRMAVRAIKHGQDLLAITSLQRAFGHDTAMIELIETEWRRK